jgi:very-short-patch-repair endonuclease
LVIEIDGDVHLAKEQKEYDEFRTFELEEQEIKVIRFTNEEVLNDIDNVVKKIEKEINLPNLP